MPEIDPVRAASALVKARAEHAISGKKMADRLQIPGVGQSWISQVERGVTSFSEEGAKRFELVAKSLKFPVPYKENSMSIAERAVPEETVRGVTRADIEATGGDIQAPIDMVDQENAERKIALIEPAPSLAVDKICQEDAEPLAERASPEKTVASNPIRDEIRALTKCLEIIEPLGDKAQRRIVEYLADLFEASTL